MNNMLESLDGQKTIQQLMGYMQERLRDLDCKAQAGTIPGEFDSYDLEQYIGRIKELRRTIAIAQEMLE
jgi:hypothetical protein